MFEIRIVGTYKGIKKSDARYLWRLSLYLYTLQFEAFWRLRKRDRIGERQRVEEGRKRDWILGSGGKIQSVRHRKGDRREKRKARGRR